MDLQPEQSKYTLKAEINGATFDGEFFLKDTKEITGKLIEGTNEEPIKYQTIDGTEWFVTKEPKEIPGGKKCRSSKKGGKKSKKNGKKTRRY